MHHLTTYIRDLDGATMIETPPDSHCYVNSGAPLALVPDTPLGRIALVGRIGKKPRFNFYVFGRHRPPLGTETIPSGAAWNCARVTALQAEEDLVLKGIIPRRPIVKATLPVSRLEELASRDHLTISELHLAQMFQANPCGSKILGGYYPIVGRSKGIAEVMRKLRVGLRITVDHYLPADGEKYLGYGTASARTMLAKQAYSAAMCRASGIKQSWRAMPKGRRLLMAAGAGAIAVTQTPAALHS